VCTVEPCINATMPGGNLVKGRSYCTEQKGPALAAVPVTPAPSIPGYTQGPNGQCYGPNATNVNGPINSNPPSCGTSSPGSR
jgi:hypothetical protein